MKLFILKYYTHSAWGLICNLIIFIHPDSDPFIIYSVGFDVLIFILLKLYQSEPYTNSSQFQSWWPHILDLLCFVSSCKLDSAQIGWVKACRVEDIHRHTESPWLIYTILYMLTQQKQVQKENILLRMCQNPNPNFYNLWIIYPAWSPCCYTNYTNSNSTKIQIVILYYWKNNVICLWF